MCIKWMVRVLAASAWLASGTVSAAIYLGGAVGQAKFETWPEYLNNPPPGSRNPRPTPHTFSDSENADTAFRIVSGFDLTRYLAIDVGYSNFGEVTAVTPVDENPNAYRFTATVSGLEAALVPRLPVSDSLALFLRFGLLRWSIDVDVERYYHFEQRFRPHLGESESGSDPFIAIGAEFAATKHLAFRGDYTMYHMDDEDLSTLMCSLIVRFTGQRTRTPKRPAPRGFRITAPVQPAPR